MSSISRKYLLNLMNSVSVDIQMAMNRRHFPENMQATTFDVVYSIKIVDLEEAMAFLETAEENVNGHVPQTRRH